MPVTVSTGNGVPDELFALAILRHNYIALEAKSFTYQPEPFI